MFSVEEVYDITADLASTYGRVSENLAIWLESGDKRSAREMYVRLATSFRRIREMALQRKLRVCLVWVLVRQ